MVSGKGIVLVHSTVAPWRKAMLLLSEASTVVFFYCLFVCFSIYFTEDGDKKGLECDLVQ